MNSNLTHATDGDTINTDVYGKSYLDGNLLAVTFTINPNGLNYFHPPQISGYKIFSITNGDYKAWNGYPIGVTWQNETNSNIVFLNTARSGIARFNAIYIKTNW